MARYLQNCLEKRMDYKQREREEGAARMDIVRTYLSTMLTEPLMKFSIDLQPQCPDSVPWCPGAAPRAHRGAAGHFKTWKERAKSMRNHAKSSPGAFCPSKVRYFYIPFDDVLPLQRRALGNCCHRKQLLCENQQARGAGSDLVARCEKLCSAQQAQLSY